MRNTLKGLSALAFASATLTACAVIPEEEPVVETPVVVELPPAPTCYEVSALQRVEVPAETKTVAAVSMIENPPYAPIEQRTEQEIVIKQAEVFYVLIDEETGDQTEITNFCEEDVEVGPVGPAAGEAFGAPTQG